MQTIPSLLRNRCLARFGTLLIAVALIAGTVGCPASPAVEQYALTVFSTEGGSVTTPGEGLSTYDDGAIVDLIATADAGYRFVEWTGDVDTIADANAASTTIAMNGDYSVTANFVAVRNLIVTSSAGGSVTAPGEGPFVYDLGSVVNLIATPDRGYRFVTWTGDVDAIADVKAATTSVSMSGDYSIAADFELVPTGAFLDEIVITQEPSPTAAIQALKEDALDVYAVRFCVYNPVLYGEVLADTELTSTESMRICDEFTFNPIGPIFPETGKLNPFSVPAFREAIHWLVDREYIATEFMSGRAVPRYTCIPGNSADATERYPDLMAEIEAEYGHNPGRAAGVIRIEMEKLGAMLEGGRWMYGGAPVEIIFLIRIEDERKLMGDYLAGLLEDLGFAVTRHYGHAGELAPIWMWGDPALGRWHIYTGGWGTEIDRDQGGSFGYFYASLSPRAANSPLWQSYVSDGAFYEAALKLWNNDYTSHEERRQLFDICLTESMKDNVRMFLVTRKSFEPMRADVRVSHELSGGVWHSWTWALTAHFVTDEGEPVVGGSMRVATSGLLSDPWNPIGGSNSPHQDRFAIIATSDMGHWPDDRTGLRWAGRIEKAEVFARTDVPLTVTNTEWCSLTFVPEIDVPLDAWADWDAANQEFLTVEERFGASGTTAKTKSISYYPKDIFEVPLHDGSRLSMGDFILYTILMFDRAKEASPIYDESYLSEFDEFMSTFKGVRYITDDPEYGLIVEYYSDLTTWYETMGSWYYPGTDAEHTVTTMFPFYSRGPGVWHSVTLGIRAEEARALAFSQPKANTLGVYWMNYIDGPSLMILKSYLEIAKEANHIPYEPTMGMYVTQAEAAERWSNLETWYTNRGHFWVAGGPFYLESADTAEKVIRLKRFEDYPDPMDRWLFLLDPLP